MADLSFPLNPSLYQTYTANGKTWYWDGKTWIYGSGPSLPPDPFWSSVTFLCRIDDALGRQVNLGSAGGVVNGVGTFSTTIARYATLGFQVDGNLSQGLVAPSNAGFLFGTGDFTLNVSVYPTALAGKNLWDFRNGGGDATAPRLWMGADGSVGFARGGTDSIVGAAGAFVVNTWTDIELAKVAGVTRLFANGVQTGASFTDAINYTQGGFTLGNGNYQAAIGTSGPQALYGQIRITKGVGRHSANFTNYTGRFPNY